MKLTNIKWETDGQAITLPSEIIVPENIEDSLKQDDNDAQILTDYLSDKYGWLVNSFYAIPTDEEIKDYVDRYNADEVGLDNPIDSEEAMYNLLNDDKYHYINQ